MIIFLFPPSQSGCCLVSPPSPLLHNHEAGAGHSDADAGDHRQGGALVAKRRSPCSTSVAPECKDTDRSRTRSVNVYSDLSLL